VPVDQQQLIARDVRLHGQRLRSIEHALPAQRGAEGVDAEALRQVAAVRGADAEHALGVVSIPVGNGPGVDRQPEWVVPGGSVESLEATAREGVCVPPQRRELVRVVRAPRIAVPS